MKILLFISAFILLLTSCDPVVDYEKKFVNSSDYDIRVIKVAGANSGTTLMDTVFIGKQSTAVVFETSGIGTVDEFSNCNSAFFDSIYAEVIDPDSLQVQLNLSDPGNWTYRVISEGKSGGGRCECYIVLTNDLIH